MFHQLRKYNPNQIIGIQWIDQRPREPVLTADRLVDIKNAPKSTNPQSWAFTKTIIKSKHRIKWTKIKGKNEKLLNPQHGYPVKSKETAQ